MHLLKLRLIWLHIAGHGRCRVAWMRWEEALQSGLDGSPSEGPSSPPVGPPSTRAQRMSPPPSWSVGPLAVVLAGGGVAGPGLHCAPLAGVAAVREINSIHQFVCQLIVHICSCCGQQLCTEQVEECCRASTLLSVCGDGGFNQWTLIRHCATGVQPYPTPDSNSGQVRLLKPSTNIHHSTINYFTFELRLKYVWNITIKMLLF